MIGEIVRAVVFTGILAFFVLVMGLLWHEAFRPLSEDDAACARIDADLDAMYGNGPASGECPLGRVGSRDPGQHAAAPRRLHQRLLRR